VKRAPSGSISVTGTGLSRQYWNKRYAAVSKQYKPEHEDRFIKKNPPSKVLLLLLLLARRKKASIDHVNPINVL
jgi:hypothetical protein